MFKISPRRVLPDSTQQRLLFPNIPGHDRIINKTTYLDNYIHKFIIKRQT